MKLSQIKAIFFHSQSFILILIFIFLWYTLDALYSYNTELIHHSGIITVSEAMVDDRVSRHNDKLGSYLRLEINTVPDNSFTVPIYAGTKRDDFVISELKQGDSVTLSTEVQLLQKISGSEQANLAIKVVTGKKVIMDYSNLAQQVSFNMLVVCSVILMALSILYILQIRRRLRHR